MTSVSDDYAFNLGGGGGGGRGYKQKNTAAGLQVDVVT